MANYRHMLTTDTCEIRRFGVTSNIVTHGDRAARVLARTVPPFARHDAGFGDGIRVSDFRVAAVRDAMNRAGIAVLETV